jgi:hypothetical protein
MSTSSAKDAYFDQLIETEQNTETDDLGDALLQVAIMNSIEERPASNKAKLKNEKFLRKVEASSKTETKHIKQNG